MRDALMNSKNIHCTAIGVDGDLRAQFGAVAEQLPHMRFVRMLDGYPDAGCLGRFLRSNPAPVVFLNSACVDKAAQVAAALESHDPTLQIIAVGPAQQETVPLALLRSGVREYLELPLQPSAVGEAVERRWHILNKMPNSLTRNLGALLSFLPAKAGVGCSTLASNISSALTAKHDKSALLADLDLNSGTVAFRYRIDPQYGVTDALTRVDELDDELWPSLVTHCNGLDVLPSRLRCEPQCDCSRMNRLLDFIRNRYEVAVFDLSGNLEPHTYEVMRESKIVYLVATQELDCLHLARAKAQFLARFDLGDRVRLLINRFQNHHSLSKAHIEDLLELKVDMVFPNEYRIAEQSVLSGTRVDARSALGKSFNEFAAHLVEKAHEPKKYRFLEYFKLPAFEHWARSGTNSKD